MKTLLISTVLALAPGLVLAQSADPAKTPAKTPAKAAAKAPIAKAKAKADPAQAVKTAKPKATPAKKQVVAKAPSATSSRVQLHSLTGQVASGLMAADAALSPAELAIAQNVYVGRMACELGAFVNVVPDGAAPGRFLVEGKGFKYHMVPVTTSTGAVRLEDTKAGAVWLQISNKSMLMNQKLGQRLADECQGAEQIVVAEAIRRNPPVSLLEHLPDSK